MDPVTIGIVLTAIGALAAAVGGAVQLLEYFEKRKNKKKEIVGKARVVNLLPPSTHRDLPLPRNRLIGRDQDVTKVCDMLMREHIVLVTLTGPPGTGKTRLSLQVAASLETKFADGVVYVELSSIRDSGLVVSAIAQALDVKENPGQSILETIKTHLLDKDLLFVLDNFEHVVSAAPNIENLIRSRTAIKILVTSRRSLNIRDEYEFQVSPLTFPKESDISPRELSTFSAIQFFIDRAQAADDTFNASTTDYIDIAEICSRLDGLPLTIELAAARIKVFKTPRALLKQLVDHSGRLDFELLTDGALDLDPRQRTLESTIAWSYDLLDENEKKVLRQLSVFAGGCTLESAAAVTNQDDVFKHVAALVEWNLLVRREEVNGQIRYALLETIREYGLKQLATNAEEKHRTEDRHAMYFLKEAESAQEHLADADMKKRMDWFTEEQDNMRTGLSWALEHNGDIALRFALVLSDFWNIMGQLTEERAALNQSLEVASDAPEELQMRVLGRAAGRQTNPEDARVYAERHLDLSRQTKNVEQEAWALHNLGNIARLKGNLSEGRQLLEDSVKLFRQQNEKTGMSLALLSLGVLALDQNDFHSARTFVSESHALAEEVGIRGHLPITRSYVAFLHHRDGDREGADDLIRQSIEMLRQDERQSWLPWALHWKGRIALERGELETARRDLTESVTIFRKNEDRGGQMRCLLAFAALYARQGVWRRATALLAAEEAQREQEGSPPAPDWYNEIQAIKATAEERLGKSEFTNAWEVGQRMSLAEAVEYAMTRASSPLR